MAPIVYVDNLSPCSRAVVLTIREAGLEDVVKVKNTLLTKGEHMAPEFVKKFPLHTVPALEDGDLYLSDSHAIVAYLVSAYAKDDKLYPKDPKKRAKVDQWLHFSNTILYNRLRDMSEPLWMKKSKVVSEERSKRAEEAYKTLDELLGDGPWLCGKDLTLADICCACEVSSMEVFIGDTKHYPKLSAWFERCKNTLDRYNELTDEQVKLYDGFIKQMMA